MNAAVLSYRAELGRKALHVGALLMPLGLLAVGREIALWVFVPLAVVALVSDVLRTRSAGFHGFIQGLFGGIMRPEERPALHGPIVFNGATWMCTAMALTALLFPEPIAAAAMAMLMLGDGAAALIGRRYGRHRWPGSPKSLEGSAAFAVSAALIVLPLALLPLSWFALPSTPLDTVAAPGLSLRQVGLGALVAAIVEALPIPLNDNVRVPLLAGAAMLLI
ncbi:MAG: diacylglycerol/polyprenol kinase family protein, partial [Bacteroidota bacterium]